MCISNGKLFEFFIVFVAVFTFTKSEINVIDLQPNISFLNFLQSFYSTKPTLDIFYDESLESSTFVEFLSTNFSFTTSVELNSIIHQKVTNQRKKTFNIIILKDFKTFSKFTENVSNFDFNFKGFFTIIFMNIESMEIKEVTSFAWQYFMQNLNIIKIESNGEFTVWTFNPFHDGKCGNTRPLRVDFSKYQTEIFPNKMKNLHKCPLRIPLFHYLPAVEFNVES